MDINHQDNRNRRLSVASCERIILYVDDFAAATGQDLSPEFYNRTKNVHASSAEPDVLRMDYRSSLYPSSSPVSLYPDNLSFQLDDRSALYPPHSAERSPSPNPLSSQTSTPRRSRCNLDVDQRSSRRSSIQSSRSRTNSCSKPTPLGRRCSARSLMRESLHTKV
ncbi:uncharacterized protein LOC113562304 [Ooceraea biroi]|uniref:uncharacterized protein LOC113562304 n=1 Tax=Ooceraea biroi TaxID=2015173 RepID=UPI0005BD071E|nr:uncharacterized protein LOC113562304 [Ooceraea biroi]